MKRSTDQQTEIQDSIVIRVVDGASAFDAVWSAFTELFGEPTSPMRALTAKIVRELAERGATGEDVLLRAGAMAALWRPQCVTPTSLWKQWSRFEGTISSIDDGDLESHRLAKRYRQLEIESGE